ncbi:hypothetical protein BDZ97DRAFT_1758230 [Flammula alnicola]|nr:hypothetical protein BDZ97DRAFT_1758230 [Flammula alnicola]
MVNIHGLDFSNQASGIQNNQLYAQADSIDTRSVTSPAINTNASSASPPDQLDSSMTVGTPAEPNISLDASANADHIDNTTAVPVESTQCQNSPAVPSTAPPTVNLFADPRWIQDTSSTKGSTSRHQTKVSAIPPHVEAAIRCYAYVPYPALPLDWTNTTAIYEGCVCAIHGDEYGNAVTAHNCNVLRLGASHGWPVAVVYDIQQCDAAAMAPSHDLSVLNMQAVTLITSCMAAQQALGTQNQHFNASKHSAPISHADHLLKCHQPASASVAKWDTFPKSVLLPAPRQERSQHHSPQILTPPMPFVDPAGNLTAFVGPPPPPATSMPPAVSSMPAPSVESEPTVLGPARPDPQQVCTSLDPSKISAVLTSLGPEDQWMHVLDGIHNSFNIGITATLMKMQLFRQPLAFIPGHLLYQLLHSC